LFPFFLSTAKGGELGLARREGRADGHQIDRKKRKVGNDGVTNPADSNNKWESRMERAKGAKQHQKLRLWRKEKLLLDSWSSGKLSRCSAMEPHDNASARSRVKSSRDAKLPVLTAILTAILPKKNYSI